MPEIWFPNLGIEIAHLDRVAFTVFGRNVYWYGIFIGLAVVLGVLMAMKEAKRTGQSPDMYVDFIIYALIFAIIGARLYYVIFSWDFYSAHPEKIFALREGGLAIYGGIIGNRLLQKERGQFLAVGGYDCTLPCVWADAGTLGEFLQQRSVWRLYEWSACDALAGESGADERYFRRGDATYCQLWRRGLYSGPFYMNRFGIFAYSCF